MYTFGYLRGYLDEDGEIVELNMRATTEEDMKKEALELHQTIDWADIFSVYKDGKAIFTEEDL